MPGPVPAPIVLDARLRGVLQHLVRRQTSPQRLVRRLRIVLAAADGLANEEIARRDGLERGTVRVNGRQFRPTQSTRNRRTTSAAVY